MMPNAVWHIREHDLRGTVYSWIIMRCFTSSRPMVFGMHLLSPTILERVGNDIPTCVGKECMSQKSWEPLHYHHHVTSGLMQRVPQCFACLLLACPSSLWRLINCWCWVKKLCIYDVCSVWFHYLCCVAYGLGEFMITNFENFCSDYKFPAFDLSRHSIITPEICTYSSAVGRALD